MKTQFIRRAVTVLFAIYIMTLGVLASSEAPGGSSSRASTNQTSDDRVWQINITAHLLKIDADSVWVHLQAPDSMKISESDIVHPIQRLPRAKNITVSDSTNSTLAIGKIMPGQKVKVKFTYKFVGSSRLALPVECKGIVIDDTLLNAKSTKKISELEDNTIIATIIEIKNNKATIFIEGGRLLSGSTTYNIIGKAIVNVEASSIMDVNGETILLNRLKQYDRVVMSTNNHVWNETEPPTYAGGDAVTIQVLNPGEYVIVSG